MKHLTMVIKRDKETNAHIAEEIRNTKTKQNETEKIKTHNVRLTVQLQIVLSRRPVTTPQPAKAPMVAVDGLLLSVCDRALVDRFLVPLL